MKYSTLALTAMLAMSQTAHAQEDGKRQSLAITVYNNNLGVVRDVRTFDLKSGISEVDLRDVPTAIDATTVKITSLNHPKGVDVLEQNYEYDLVSQHKLLEKYIDQTISVTDDKGVKLEGTLLAVEHDRLTLQTPTGITMLPNLIRYSINVPKLPSGLITKPTLVWKINAQQAYNNEPLEVLYQTAGMSWHAEYIAALSEDDKSLDLTGWVSLENTSGASYENAKLKLVAGALNRVRREYVPMYKDGNRYDEGDVMVPQFEERGLFEYHIYDLQRPTSIMNNEVKQVALLEGLGVMSEKRYTYRGGRSVEVSVAFENSEKNKLGIPIPQGIVRVMKKDKDGTYQFVGEDRVKHTPRDEKITLKVGDAFDITGERIVTESAQMGQHANKETIQITLKNAKDEAVEIDVHESLGQNWEILRKSHDFEKKNAYEVVFKVPIKARSEAKLTYTVLRSWQ